MKKLLKIFRIFASDYDYLRSKMTEPTTIDQSGVLALIEESLMYPELYADKPLFIWQADYNDGIQQELVMKPCLDFDKGKAKEERSYFRLTTVRENENHLKTPDKNSKGHLAGYVITTRTLSLQHYLSEVGKLIEENNKAFPLIVYLPYRYEWSIGNETCFNADQFIFSPDFEEWAETWSDSTIPDFIRGNGDSAGITYRWYNLFNDPNKGCTTPNVWLAVSSFLNGCTKLKRNNRTGCGLNDLDDDLILSAFQAGMKASKGHISNDIIDSFVKYLKTMADKNRLIHPYAATPNYSCSLIDGVLHINGAHWLAGNRVFREYEHDLEAEFESPFVHLDFHTAVIGKDIKYLCEGCFNGCKNLKKIVLHDGIEAIENPIALNTCCDKEFVNDDDSNERVNEHTVAQGNTDDDELPF